MYVCHPRGCLSVYTYLHMYVLTSKTGPPPDAICHSLAGKIPTAQSEYGNFSILPRKLRASFSRRRLLFLRGTIHPPTDRSGGLSLIVSIVIFSLTWQKPLASKYDAVGEAVPTLFILLLPLIILINSSVTSGSLNVSYYILPAACYLRHHQPMPSRIQTGGSSRDEYDVSRSRPTCLLKYGVWNSPHVEPACVARILICQRMSSGSVSCRWVVYICGTLQILDALYCIQGLKLSDVTTNCGEGRLSSSCLVPLKVSGYDGVVSVVWYDEHNRY
ncbi:hypothetical protein F4779DRAFT_282997 [Xylariaceae sp. FL0662B]|nr:hypothetical protein F4779DRAFT_282997 [Xylariaceae sp. FL0662B]